MNQKSIFAIVINSISHDTRVQKEARSLQNAGYQVTIFGIRDDNQNKPETRLNSGALAVRVPWRSKLFMTVAVALSAVAIVTLAVLGGVSFFLYRLLEHHLESIFGFFKYLAYWQDFRTWVIVLLALIYPTYFFARRIWNYFTEALKFRRLDEPEAFYPKQKLSALVRFLRRFYPYVKLLRYATPKGIAEIANTLTRIAYDYIIHREIEKAILARGEKPFAIHCHDLSTLLLGSKVAKHFSARVVYDAHEIYEKVPGLTRLDQYRYIRQQRIGSKNVDALISVNDSAGRYLNSQYPNLPPAVIVKNAAEKPRQTVKYDGRLHRAASVHRTSKILLYQGGFQDGRGLIELIESAPLLPKDWVVVMMGWGRLEEDLKLWAEIYDPKGKRVRFIPPAPLHELPKWTAGGSLGIIAYENLSLNMYYCAPNKLWEYPVAGVPIIASDLPEIRNVMETHNIGKLFPESASAYEIAETVASIDDAELQQFKINCRAMIEVDNWSIYGDRLVEAYDALHQRGH